MIKLSQFVQQRYPGITLAVLLGVAAIAIAEKYAGPVMLFAILIGLALHPAYESEKLQSGINWCARPLLLTGVALLGFRVNIHDFSALGVVTPIIILGSLIATIIAGYIFAKFIGISPRLGILISGSVAICGVSAAVAISSALPKGASRDRDLSLTVAGITVMSTLAMISYPVISSWLNHSTLQAGIFLGGSIHDVAQVVGAGYSVSDGVGDTATLVKLVRVSALLPVVLIIGYVFRDKSTPSDAQNIRSTPVFLIVFLIIAVINSYELLPVVVQELGVMTSKLCLIISLVAIGLKTNLHSVASVGKTPLILLISNSLFLAVISATLVALFI